MDASLLFTVALAVCAQADDPTLLRVGEPIRDVIEDGAPEVHTDVLDQSYTNAPTVGLSYRIRVDEPGPYHVELRSHFFDAYLVLRDAADNVLAQDDDGGLLTHSLLAVPEVVAGATYVLDACALHGARGPFELVLRRGLPEPSSETERAAAELGELERRVAAIGVREGPESVLLARALHDLGSALRRAGRFPEARATLERSLAIREQVLGSVDPFVAQSLDHLGELAHAQGELALARRLHERALAIREAVLGPEHALTAHSMNDVSRVLLDLNELAAARPLLERLLGIREVQYGPLDERVAARIGQLADVASLLGDLEEARYLYGRALAIYEEVRGPEHPYTATALYNLGTVLFDLEDHEGARPLLERALAIRENLLGAEDDQTSAVRDDLGRLLVRAGELEAARPLYERSLEISERRWGPEHPETRRAMEQLAKLLATLGEDDASGALFRRIQANVAEGLFVLEVDEPVRESLVQDVPEGGLDGYLAARAYALAVEETGRYHVDLRSHHFNALLLLRDARGTDLGGASDGLLGSDARLVFTLEAGNQYVLLACAHNGGEGPYELVLRRGEPPRLPPAERAAAELEHLERGLRVVEESDGRESPAFARVLNLMGNALYRQGRYAEARPAYEEALAILEARLGPGHPRVASGLNNLGLLLNEVGDLDGARAVLERCVVLREELFGPDHRDTAAALDHLGQVLYSQGELDEALGLIERALAIREADLGPEHPTTLLSVNNAAELLQTQGHLAEARELHERALVASEKALGPDHPDTATTLSNLARILETQGELDAARVMLERALAIREQALGPRHPATASTLNDLASLLGRLHESEAARVLIERAIAIREEVFGPDNRSKAQSLTVLAQILQGQGELEAARPLFERALSILERSVGPDHYETGITANNLARLLELLGEFEAAREYSERAFRIHVAALRPDHPDTGKMLKELAGIVYRQGDLVAARAHFERALAIRKAALGPEAPGVGECLHDLAKVLADLGELEAALEHLERALAIFTRIYGLRHPSTATTLDNLAGVLADLRGAEAALPLYEQALSIREEILGPDHPDVARSLNNLAVFRMKLGDLTGARPLLERSLAIREERLGSEHPDVAIGLNSLALLLDRLGEDEAALALFERALALSEAVKGPDHPHTAIALGCVASVSRELGQAARAEALLERALRICDEVYPSGSRATSTILHGLGGALRDRGERTAARRAYERALAINEEQFGSRHPDAASSRFALAQLLEELGERTEALAMYEQAYADLESALGPASPRTADSRTRLALLLAESGGLGRARDLLLDHSDGWVGHLASTLGGLSEAESFRYFATLRWQLDVLLSLCASGDADVNVRAYERLLEWKGRIARTQVATREQLARALTPQQHELVDRLRGAQMRLSRVLFEEPAADPGAEEALLARARRERNELELELARTLESDSPAVRTPSLAELREALPPRTAVLDLFEHRPFQRGTDLGREVEEHLVAWIVRPSPRGRADGAAPVVRVDLGPARAVEEALRAHLLQIVSGGGAGSDARGPGLLAASEREAGSADLRRRLWDPLAPHLEGVETLVVSPDGALCGLPFETVRLEDGEFLVERLAFAYLSDVTALVRREPEPSVAVGALLAVGGVDFAVRGPAPAETAAPAPSVPDSRRVALRGALATEWSALPETGPEVLAIAELHASTGRSSRRVLRAAEPTEERLKLELGRHAVVHLATHGFFQPEGTRSLLDSALGARDEATYLVGQHPGLLSGLVCAGANGAPPAEADDGYLTAEEVGWLDLGAVELVVLSACQTGLGEARSGEGLVGLRRAFRTAGARTVVSSLWQVEDASTAELMRDFYGNLWVKGMGRLEALRTAQLAMLARNRAEHGDALPRTWGAFVLSGEWR